MSQPYPCGHPRSPENTRTRPNGTTQCRTCDRRTSQAWKERNREANRARDRAYLAQAEMRGVCANPICTRLRGVGMARREAGPGYCEECKHAVEDVRRTLAEGMWADGWTFREMAAAFGITKDRVGIRFAQWRKGGYADAFPYRRTPDQVARITAGWQRVADRRAAA